MTVENYFTNLILLCLILSHYIWNFTIRKKYFFVSLNILSLKSIHCKKKSQFVRLFLRGPVRWWQVPMEWMAKEVKFDGEIKQSAEYETLFEGNTG